MTAELINSLSRVLQRPIAGVSSGCEHESR